MKSQPRVSVLLNARNAGDYIEKALQSILGQSFKDFELIVIDDGSDDGSETWLKEFEKTDDRVKLFRLEPSGIPKALNFGLSVARGDLIAKMDADDESLPNRFSEQVKAFESDDELVLLGSEVELVDECDRPLGIRGHPRDHSQIRRHLLLGNGGALTHPAVMFKKKAALEIGGYDEDFPVGSDLDIFLRLTEVGKAANLDAILLNWRQHSTSVNRTKFQGWQELKRVALKNTIDRIGIDQYVNELFPIPGVWSFPSTQKDLALRALNHGRPSTAIQYAKMMLGTSGQRKDGVKILAKTAYRKLRNALS